MFFFFLFLIVSGFSVNVALCRASEIRITKIRSHGVVNSLGACFEQELCIVWFPWKRTWRAPSGLSSVLGDGLTNCEDLQARVEELQNIWFHRLSSYTENNVSVCCVSNEWWWRCVVSAAGRWIESWEAAAWQRGFPCFLSSCLQLFAYLFIFFFLLAARQSWISVILQWEIWLPKGLGFVHYGLWALCTTLNWTRHICTSACLLLCQPAERGARERKAPPQQGKSRGRQKCKKCEVLAWA